MSKSNPRKALAALLPAPIRIGALGVEVRPFTLATFAVLEKIGSPMLPAAGPVHAGVFDLLPTLYAATHVPAECLDQIADGTFSRNVLEWADTIPGTAMPLLKDAILMQVGTMQDVVPESPEKKNDGHNGWITALAEWACRTYGWTWDEAVFQVPASVLALFWRQSRYSYGNARVMHLSEIEEIDDRLEMARLKGQADHG